MTAKILWRLRDFFWVFWALVFLVGAGWLVAAVVFPLVGQLQTNNDEITRVGEEVALLGGKKAILESLTDKELTELTAKARAALPEEKSFPGLLSGLENLAETVGAKVVYFDSAPGLISRGAKSGGKTVAPVPVEGKLPGKLAFLTARVGLVADYKSVVNFAQRLHRSSRLVAIQDLSFRQQAGLPGGQNVTVNLQVYYQPEETTKEILVAAISEEEKAVIAGLDAFNKFLLSPQLSPAKPDPFTPVAPPPAR